MPDLFVDASQLARQWARAQRVTHGLRVRGHQEEDTAGLLIISTSSFRFCCWDVQNNADRSSAASSPFRENIELAGGRVPQQVRNAPAPAHQSQQELLERVVVVF